ncbi:MAG TPA: hypothetical protein VMZ52_03055 [Bryobacteraceae bacterium]|nr:hypothetical protein [Bryobacteraceae bacterium]
MNKCEGEYFHHYFIGDGVRREHSLYLHPVNAGFQIDHAARTVRGGPCDCTWELSSTLPDDSNCTRTAELRLWEGKRTDTGQIAGHAVVSYRSVDEDDAVTELSLAPGLGCQVMREVRTWPGTFGIPGAKWQYQVTSYKSGEPDPSLFRLPAGYTLKK